jgi:hypothetical protein
VIASLIAGGVRNSNFGKAMSSAELPSFSDGRGRTVLFFFKEVRSDEGVKQHRRNGRINPGASTIYQRFHYGRVASPALIKK